MNTLVFRAEYQASEAELAEPVPDYPRLLLERLRVDWLFSLTDAEFAEMYPHLAARRADPEFWGRSELWGPWEP